VFAEIARNKQTTGLGHVTIADMKRLFVCRPPEPVADAFDGYANPVFERMITNQSEIRKLTILRDTLLPKLISGELQIPQAGALVEVHI
jgi:type I restriction enzyme S subunit